MEKRKNKINIEIRLLLLLMLFAVVVFLIIRDITDYNKAPFAAIDTVNNESSGSELISTTFPVDYIEINCSKKFVSNNEKCFLFKDSIENYSVVKNSMVIADYINSTIIIHIYPKELNGK